MQSGPPDARYALVQQVAGVWNVDFETVPYDTARKAAPAADAHRQGWANAVSTGWLTD